MEGGIDFHDYQFATPIELDTSLGKFEKGPILHWS